MIAAGSIIDGTVIDSVIGRGVVVKKGAIIKSSYIMSNCFIEENAEIEFAIFDKQSIVKENTLAVGTLRNPFLSQKEQIVTNFEKMRVLLVASESYPFIKTGGLADVIGSLSRNLARLGVDVTVIIPYYKKIKTSFTESIRYDRSMKIEYNQKIFKVEIHSYIYKKVKHYFIDNFNFFDTDNVYGYENDVDRFAFFNKAVVEMLDDFEPFDVIHVHDWHTSLIPIIIDNSKHKNTKTLLTLHNVDYQGIADVDVIQKLGIKNFIIRDRKINCLEIGINTATKLNTVSPTYKEELKYEYYGKNLTHSLMRRERDFYGILNGISSTWNPATDKLIYENYSWDTYKHKEANKVYLQKIMNLPQDNNNFIIGMVTRIVEQKGFDLLLNSFDVLLSNHPDIQFVLLGSGDGRYIEALRSLEARHPHQIKLNIGYDATVPNFIYAGADVFLMPSRFEPCGLGQLIALKYGTLPIVRSTGGLNDTVDKYDPLTKKGNGFAFSDYDANQMKDAILQAYHLFKNSNDDWQKLIHRAMKENNSIRKYAAHYIDLYKVIMEKID